MFFPSFDTAGLKYFTASPLCPVVLLSLCFKGYSSSGVIIKLFFEVDLFDLTKAGKEETNAWGLAGREPCDTL